MKTLLALAVTALLAVRAYAGDYPTITVAEVKSAIESKKVVLLDANGTGTWKRGHIPGAIDYASNESNLAGLLPKDKSALIVAYCGGPKCRAYQAAAKAAEKLGYKNVKHLVAGISGWKEAGEKVETAS